MNAHAKLSIMLLFALSTVSTWAGDFYVSPDGNDANSGSKEKPFATLSRARDAVRQAKAQAKEPFNVLIRGGTYAVTEPLVLGPGDSGTRECPITYAACPNEKPVFRGGKVITGWKRGQGHLWTAEIPEVKQGQWYFRQLFVNGQRRPRARLPKEGFYTVAGPGDPAKRAFKFNPGELDPAWRNRDDVEVIVLQFWTEGRLRIESIDTAANMVKFTGDAFRPLSWSKGWYVENVYEGLLRPGDWYLDRQTGVLHYWPMPGEDVDKLEIVAPTARHWIRLEGDWKNGKPVEHISFRGLTFHYSDWSLDPKLGYSYPQAAIEQTPNQPLWQGWAIDEGQSIPQSQIEVPAGIWADGADHIRFENNEIAHTGGWGIDLSLGCQNNAICGNHLYDLGAGAVRVGSPDICFRRRGGNLPDGHLRQHDP